MVRRQVKSGEEKAMSICSGDVSGDVYGDVSGDVYGDVSGEASGDTDLPRYSPPSFLVTITMPANRHSSQNVTQGFSMHGEYLNHKRFDEEHSLQHVC